MARRGEGESRPPQVEAWEMELLTKISLRFRTADRDELRADLAAKLLFLKTHLPSGIRNWKAYLAKFLFNKAANWVRDQRAREARSLSISHLHEQGVDSLAPEDVLKFPELGVETRVAFVRLWQKLDPHLQLVWQLLLEEEGNQTEVARRLGKHRNTVRLWIREIHQALKQQGF